MIYQRWKKWQMLSFVFMIYSSTTVFTILTVSSLYKQLLWIDFSTSKTNPIPFNRELSDTQETGGRDRWERKEKKGGVPGPVYRLPGMKELKMAEMPKLRADRRPHPASKASLSRPKVCRYCCNLFSGWRHGGRFAIFLWGTLMVAILLWFSSKLQTR